MATVAFAPIVGFLALFGGLGLPLSVPPLPEDPLLAKIAPEECLFYMSWSGMAAPEAKSPNQTEQLLAEPEVQNFAAEIERAVVAGVKAGMSRSAAPPPVPRPDRPNLIPPAKKVSSFGAGLPTPPQTPEKGDRRSPPVARSGDRATMAGDRATTASAADLTTPPRVAKITFAPASPGPGPLAMGEGAISRGPVTEREGDAVGDAVQWGKRLLTRPMAVFLSAATIGAEGPEIQGGAALNLGEDAAKLKAALEKYQAMLPGEMVEKATVGAVQCYRLKFGRGAPVVTWCIKGKYVLVGIGEGGIEGILKRAGGAPPAWLTAIRKQLPVQRVSTVMYVNTKAIITQFAPMGGPQVATVLDAIGVTNVTSLVSVTGLDGQDFVSRMLIGLDGEPAGMLRLLAGKPLTAADLAPIPRDATIAAAARVDAADAMEAFLALFGMQPRGGLAEIDQALGINIRDDLLKPLGDVWCVYNSPGEGGFLVTGLTAVVQVKDHKRLAATHAKLLAQAKAGLQQEAERRATGPYYRRAAPRIEQFQFAGQDVYFFNARESEFPLAPAWCLTEKELIISTFPQHVKAYLSRGAGALGAGLPTPPTESIATEPAVAAMLADGGPTCLSYVDSRKLLEVIYPAACIFGQMLTAEMARGGIDLNISVLPQAATIARHLRPSVAAVRRTPAGIELTSRGTMPGSSVGPALPLATAMLMPAVGTARTSARRVQSSNNLKQIALAMHNYASANGTFPPAFIADKQTGKPLLSWRVAILPYIEQQALYQQFHMDEPWDSPHNKPLANTVISVYRHPASRAAPNMTNYLTVRGKDTAFPGKDAIRFQDITDGLTNTIMVVEASDAKAVPWTKPDDFEYDEKNPAAGLGLTPGGFNAAFCDGSVRFLSTGIAPETLRNLFNRNDGKPTPDDALR